MQSSKNCEFEVGVFFHIYLYIAIKLEKNLHCSENNDFYLIKI